VEQSLEVEAGAGGDRVAGQQAFANGMEAGPGDESGTAAEREKPLDGMETLDVAAG